MLQLNYTIKNKLYFRALFLFVLIMKSKGDFTYEKKI